MDFRLDDEQVALRDACRALCRQHFDLDAVASREGVAIADASWRALTAMGILGLLAPGEAGGAIEAVIVFEQLGAHLATGPLRWTTIAAPLVDGAASGNRRLTGVDAETPTRPYVVEHADESDTLVVLRAEGVERCAIVQLGPSNTGTPLDPLTRAAAYDDLPHGESIGSADDADRLRSAGTIVTAAELVGAAQGALDVASAYARERHQFGVPIGSFQAIKHLLADMYVRVELARSATYAAAAIFDEPLAGEVAVAASTAKLLAGEAGIANGRAAVQVLGGMGFTWEMLPHYFLKRSWLLEQSFGTGDAHALALSAGAARFLGAE
jgi:alkylation response protein AidB-like acyl-CoA dehydrogenase